ncbi:MAG: phosphate ABC transporter permease PstA, partial [Alphaproteobacteria bacterium]|nr:phosphate ABC transporter permease PstA [Alphaproteobacteria bacterium]
MTDLSNARIATQARQSAVNSRMAKRYAAERRFRYYGVAAIIVTGLFVLALILDIVFKGFPAFFEHRLLLQVTASQDLIDPDNSGDPAKLRAGDFDGIIRAALRAEMPFVTKRADRKLLNGLLSSGAADDFRTMVVDNPRLVGKDLTVPVILSDDADQYLKGYQTDVVRRTGSADLNVVADGENVTLETAAPELEAMRGRLKSFLSVTLDRDRRQHDRLDQAVSQLTTKAEQAASDAERDSVAVELATLTARRDAIASKVDDLAAQVAGNGNAIQLSGNLPSVLIEVGPAVYRLTSLEANVAKADAIIAVDAAESAPAGRWHLLELTTPENDRRTSDREVVWLERLKANGSIEKGFAWRFLTSGDSREPELAGIRGALVGSILTLAVTLLICLPLGVGAAIYLEEFAPKNRLTDLIEININNLAAVPSIVFGLLGLAMFLNFFGLPRSAPLVGGLVLALLVLPTIIIASRAALKAVPPSIKEAALGVGASHQQAIFHHVLPLAVPGIMTGTIIGMAHALGETAPLLMIGM